MTVTRTNNFVDLAEASATGGNRRRTPAETTAINVVTSARRGVTTRVPATSPSTVTQKLTPPLKDFRLGGNCNTSIIG
jgi:hypothetical protein